MALNKTLFRFLDFRIITLQLPPIERESNPYPSHYTTDADYPTKQR
jgi:hypothetical protein